MSLEGCLTENKKIGRKHLYFAYNDLIRSVKYKGYKLIKYKNALEHTQLFNVDRDPGECHNLYGKEEVQGKVSELEALMQFYKNTWEDTGHPYTQSFWNK